MCARQHTRRIPRVAGRKQPITWAGCKIKITEEILAQRRDAETHSSREGFTVCTGASRKEICGCSNFGTDRLSEIAADNWKIIRQTYDGIPTIWRVSVTIRQYDPHDFAPLHKLDRACFPPGIAYSKTMLRYFLAQPGAECLVAADGGKIVGFILSEENPPLAHIVTLDVVESYRRHKVGTELLREIEANLKFRGVRTVLLETATTNEAGIAFWERHGYRKEAVLKNYYPGLLDAFEMRKKLIVSAFEEKPRKPQS
jgi:[ribosomal protein S18]-alanine N-acetyltransferase